MTGNEYQKLAARTINQALTTYEKKQHALFGMSAEVGELYGIFQKRYQGHKVEPEHIKKELGKGLRFLSHLDEEIPRKTDTAS